MTADILLHGGALDLMKQRFPKAPTPWLDLSTGINPWSYPYAGSSEKAAKHLPTATQFDDCLQAMSTAIDAPAESLLLAPGSELLIRLLPDIIPARHVCISTPTYGDHAKSWGRSTAKVTESHDALTDSGRADILVVCNPNNPDGRTWSKDCLSDACQRLAERGGWLIVDEAYADLDPKLSMASSGGKPGLIVLRSFGKFFGLAGIRLGALIAPQSILHAMRERLGVWPVAGPTLEIATQAYSDLRWQIDMRRRLETACERLDAVLSTHELSIDGGTSLYRYLRLADAEATWRVLAEQGVYTRRFKDNPHAIRIGLPSADEDFQRLDAALSVISP